MLKSLGCPLSVIGVVGSARGDVETQKLREISVLLDLPPMPKNLILFIEWVVGYTLARLGNVLRMTMSVPQAPQPPKKIAIYDLVPGVMEKANHSQPVHVEQLPVAEF